MTTQPGERQDFTCESIVNDFNLLQELVADSDEHYFSSKFMTPLEILQESKL